MIVGAQWGDEGKGKIVDLLAQDSDLVCRYQGGPNAGHTIVVGDETYKIRQIPSGVIRGKTCVIGAGCVVDPQVFLAEVDALQSRGHSTADIRVSGEAHLISPWGTWEWIGPPALGAVVPARGTVELAFAITPPAWLEPGQWWALVRVGCAGRLVYSPAVKVTVT